MTQPVLTASLRSMEVDEALGRQAELAEIWPDGAERLEEVLQRHAAREGFRLVAGEKDGRLIGFGYGHVGSPGEWWRESVAAAMTPEQREKWLGPGHFEFVELHLLPEWRRQGVGSALHNAIIERLESRTVVASIRADNAPALSVARSLGYRLILSDFRFTPKDAPYCILGLELA